MGNKPTKLNQSTRMEKQPSPNNLPTKSTVVPEPSVEQSVILKRIKTCNECLEGLSTKQDEILKRLSDIEHRLDQIEAWKETQRRPRTPKKESHKKLPIESESQIIEQSLLIKRPQIDLQADDKSSNNQGPALNNVWKTRYQQARAQAKVDKLGLSKSKKAH